MQYTFSIERPGVPAEARVVDPRGPSITIGRDPRCGLVVSEVAVSRRHARVLHELGDDYVEDVGSTQGTRHNGERLVPGRKKLLRNGDVIGIAGVRVTYWSPLVVAAERRAQERTVELTRRLVEEIMGSAGGPSLRVMSGVGEGARLALDDPSGGLTIGRSPDCDLALPDDSHGVSRHHCLVERRGDGFYVRDLASRTGVRVGGEAIEGARRLTHGDEIEVGAVSLLFLDPGARVVDPMEQLPEAPVEAAPVDAALVDAALVEPEPGTEPVPDPAASELCAEPADPHDAEAWVGSEELRPEAPFLDSAGSAELRAIGVHRIPESTGERSAAVGRGILAEVLILAASTGALLAAISGMVFLCV